ncbi:MAG: DNA alkylation repair protein [Chitinophagales bacterium]
MSELEIIQQRLKIFAKKSTAESIKKFVPGATRVYGVKNPELNAIAKEFKSGGFELINTLWKSGSYEERIIAAKMIREIAKKNPEEVLETVKRFSGDIDNWALCDTLGMQSLKPVNKLLSDKIFAFATKLSSSKDPWKRRLSLVIVEDFSKDKNFHAAIKKLIAVQKDDKSYYIKKAVDWLERNLKKPV